MDQDLSRLLLLLPRPDDAPQDTDWQSVESALGAPLPNDYKELVRTYGGGYIDDYLLLLEPDCPSRNYDLITKTAQRAEAYLFARDSTPTIGSS